MSWLMIVLFVDMLLQVLVNYARSSKEAEEVSKEVNDFTYAGLSNTSAHFHFLSFSNRT